MFASWHVPLGPHGGFVHGEPVWQSPPTQSPFTQWSHVAPNGEQVFCVVSPSSVHELPSWHRVPFVFADPLEQFPVAGLHVPALWHWSDAWQTTGLLPTHCPA